MLKLNVQNTEQIVPSIATGDLEWCANWEQEDRFYCTLFIRNAGKYSKPKGFHNLLEELFGSKYGGFRYDQYRHGYECWFRNREDMLTFKLLAGNGNKRKNY